MTLEGTVHCEAEDCLHHAHVGASTMAAGRLPIGFVTVRFFEGNGSVIDHHFCEPNCALKWLAANTKPSEVFDPSGDNDA